MYICIGVYMNTHSKAVKCLKRDSLKPFLGKITQKTTFLKLFPCYEKRLHSPFIPLHRQNKEVWVSGLNQHTANVPNRKVPKVRILSLRKLALSHNGSAADSGSASGGSIPSGATSVRSFGRLGVCAGLKIPRTWFDSTRLHFKIRECSSGNEGGLEFLELAKKSAV